MSCVSARKGPFKDYCFSATLELGLLLRILDIPGNLIEIILNQNESQYDYHREIHKNFTCFGVLFLKSQRIKTCKSP